MQNWDDLKYCLALQRYKTMTAAAHALGTNTATVSRRIDRMNDQFSRPLFVKEGTQWRPTKFADNLITLAARTEEKIKALELGKTTAEQTRSLRINGAFVLMQTDLLTAIGSLYQEMPDLELSLSMKPASLAFGETDLLISTTPPEEGRLISKQIGAITSRVYACKEHANALEGWVKINGDDIHKPLHEQLFMEFDSPAKLSIDGNNMALQMICQSPLCSVLNVDFADQHDHLTALPGFDEITNEVWISYHVTRKTDDMLRQAANWLEMALFGAPEPLRKIA